MCDAQNCMLLHCVAVTFCCITANACASWVVCLAVSGAFSQQHAECMLPLQPLSLPRFRQLEMSCYSTMVVDLFSSTDTLDTHCGLCKSPAGFHGVKFQRAVVYPSKDTMLNFICNLQIDPLHKFYTTLKQQRPDSEMAKKWYIATSPCLYKQARHSPPAMLG